MTEHQLQKDIVAWLSEQGCVVWRNGTTGHHDRGRSQRATRGVPDITGFTASGRGIAIEVKLPGNHCSENQRTFLRACADRNVITGVAHSLSEARLLYQEKEPKP